LGFFRQRVEFFDLVAESVDPPDFSILTIDFLPSFVFWFENCSSDPTNNLTQKFVLLEIIRQVFFNP
jgi:hypothetical protein